MGGLPITYNNLLSPPVADGGLTTCVRKDAASVGCERADNNLPAATLRRSSVHGITIRPHQKTSREVSLQLEIPPLKTDSGRDLTGRARKS